MTQKFDFVITSYDFRHNNADKCVYSKFTNKFGVVNCLYVNDCLIFGTKLEGFYATKKYLTSIFKIDLNKVDTILWFKVKKHSEDYALCQSHYIKNMLLKFDYLQIKEANTLYDSSIKILEDFGLAIA